MAGIQEDNTNLPSTVQAVKQDGRIDTTKAGPKKEGKSIQQTTKSDR